MSMGVISNQTDKENSVGTENVKKMSLTGGTVERKSLKTLQLSSDGRLMGLEKSMHKNRIIPSKKPVKVFPDTSTPKITKTFKRVEIGVQVNVDRQECETQTDPCGASGMSREPHNDSGVGVTDIDQEAYDLMVKEPIPENYWRDLAEERRLSLAEALSENEMLHQSIEELHEENQNLSLLAGQAEHLASVLNDLMGEDGDQDKQSDDDDDDDTSDDKHSETNDKSDDKTNDTTEEDKTESTETETQEDKQC